MSVYVWFPEGYLLQWRIARIKRGLLSSRRRLAGLMSIVRPFLAIFSNLK